MTEICPSVGEGQANNSTTTTTATAATTAVEEKEKYGPVVLTISNSVLPLDKLSPTPSSLDGLEQSVEDDLRNLGCDLIQTAGKLLKLPQVAMATSSHGHCLCPLPPVLLLQVLCQGEDGGGVHVLRVSGLQDRGKYCLLIG